MVKIVGPVLLLAAIMPCSATAWKNPYNKQKKYEGEGTFYGVPPVGSGHCSLASPLPDMYDGMVPVAINHDQYDGSATCGACVQGKHGDTEIKFKGYVMDECPECAYGDLDFGVDGTEEPYSAGRWNMNWRFVPCPNASEEPTFIFEGSSDWYWKIQPRGLSAPVTRLWVDGEKATRTVDNFFEIKKETFSENETVKVKTMLGDRVSLTVSRT